jgi:uncharacterized membrane protein YccC
VLFRSIALATSTGLTTFIAAYFFPDSTGAWAVLTILLVMKPKPTDMWQKARHRVGGTLLGAVLAAAVVIGMQELRLPLSSLSAFVGAVLLILALSVIRVRPYWQFVTLLTPSIIFLKSSGADTLDLDAQRVLMTILGTLVALSFAVVVRAINLKIGNPRSSASATP